MRIKSPMLSAHQPHPVFDSLHGHGVCMVDGDGRIISWNTLAERNTGYNAEEVVGKNYSIFFTREDTRRKVFTRALGIAAKKGRAIVEGTRVRKDGTHALVRLYITPIKEEARSATFFIVIAQDITHEKEKAQKRDEYIGIASHELKSPITTLSLYSELLAKRLQLSRDKKNLQMLRDMQTQTARLVTLVDDLLTISKIEGSTLELHKQAFDPNLLVKRVIRDFQNTTQGHKISCVGSCPKHVRADKDRITQVLINLLSNAVKYSPRADKVIVRIGRVKNKCLISSQDFGPGIPKKYQQKIFSRFFRADDAETDMVAGSGLGLYISKEIIKKHRERLWVHSIEGKGTTFSFTLPLA